MNIDIEFLQKITHGAIKITENADGYSFYRLTECQLQACMETAPEYNFRALSSAGMRFEFITDAASFNIKGRFRRGSSRTCAYLDVKVNGIIVQHTGTDDYTANPDFEMTVNLDGSKNHVAVYLPNLAQFILQDLNFSNASFIEPVKKDLTMVCWGDSITQGYDTLYPSLSYANSLSDKLNAVLYNKAVGGEVFNPAYFNEFEPLKPDIITIAYGTNDWNKRSESDLKTNAAAFLEKITSFYPDAVFYLIAPIWRADTDRITDAGTFDNARNIIFDICRNFSNINVIDGMKLIPHETGFFKDKYLHPNDLGFMCMTDKLLEYIKRP
ncbi:MAG: SGNH/GDSL hydrolase family protein [Lentisphaeria bacterium]|nr:SGNH/GDSL hydrolase family protein [Lentisphaeria bacterium]